MAIRVRTHDQQPDAIVTITPEDTLQAALNERPAAISEQRWADYNRKFNALLMGRDREPTPHAPVQAAPESSPVPPRQPPTRLPIPRQRRTEWAEINIVLLVALGALAVDLAVAMSLGAPLGIMGLALVGRGLVRLGEL